MSTISLEPVESVTVTTLIDNSCDLLLTDQGPAKRASLIGGNIPLTRAYTLDGGKTQDHE